MSKRKSQVSQGKIISTEKDVYIPIGDFLYTGAYLETVDGITPHGEGSLADKDGGVYTGHLEYGYYEGIGEKTFTTMDYYRVY